MKAGLVLISIFSITLVFGQHFQPVENSSTISFAIKNFGVKVSGSFKGLHGSIQFDEKNLSASVFDVSVDANTVNTGNGTRDNHLRKEEYFDVQKFSKISFVSKQVSASGAEGMFTVTGTLTIKGTSKEISFPFKATRQMDGFLFTGSFKLNRRDYKVGGSSMILSDNLEVSLSVFAKK
jgi:polyisoprenoid-binding protein YceI